MMNEQDERAEMIAGLRALADTMEAHPEIPVPTSGASFSPLSFGFHGENARERVIAAGRAMPCSLVLALPGDGQFAELRGHLAGLHVALYARREELLSSRVTGYEVMPGGKRIPVTEHVIHPDVLEALAEEGGH